MGRIRERFSRRNTAVFIGFTVAGDPDTSTSLQIAEALVEGGADILELGVPFSDPVADGPVIQRGVDRALKAGTIPQSVFGIAKEIRKRHNIPLVLLTYYNIIHRHGVERFYCEAHEAGVDGILVVDLPVEESDGICRAAERSGIDPLFLVSQTTSDERIRRIVSKAGGFLYIVSRLGVTGVRNDIPGEVEDLIRRVRRHTALPLAMGFGISTPAQARACIHWGADGVIVGSAIVEIVERNLGDPLTMADDLKGYISSLKESLSSIHPGNG